jgi:hypothetical protein
MDNDKEKDLFGIRLNETGANYIQKLTNIGWILFILIILLSGLYLIVSIKTFEWLYGQRYSGYISRLSFLSRLSPFLLLITASLNFGGGYSYLQFCRSLKKSIEINNEYSFNHSFSHIYRMGFFCICLICLNLFSTFLSFTSYMKW